MTTQKTSLIVSSVGQYPTKKLASGNHYKTWRHRIKCKQFKRSTAEKHTLVEAQHNHEVSYLDALNAAMQVLEDEAYKLHAQFRAHSVDYYLKEIMQRSRKTKGTRKINPWNVFLRQEVKRINESQSGSAHISKIPTHAHTRCP